jgi:hypothetical protein
MPICTGFANSDRKLSMIPVIGDILVSKKEIKYHLGLERQM